MRSLSSLFARMADNADASVWGSVAKKPAILAGSSEDRSDSKIFESSSAPSTCLKIGSQGLHRIFCNKSGMVKEALQMTASLWGGITTEFVTTSSLSVLVPEP